MSQIIKKFSDGSLLKFGQGKFDQWCVYHVDQNDLPSAIKDITIFSNLQRVGQTMGAAKVYSDFVKIYDLTDKSFSPAVIKEIEGIACDYGNHHITFDFLLTVLYAVMIAEENRAKSRLYKRIKRLGVHQLLVENYTPEQAANFSKGMPWTKISDECQARGF